MTTTPPIGPTRTPRGIGIDPRLGAVSLRAPPVSREDSRPQAILKFHCPSSLDYRARHGPPVTWVPYLSPLFGFLILVSYSDSLLLLLVRLQPEPG